MFSVARIFVVLLTTANYLNNFSVESKYESLTLNDGNKIPNLGLGTYLMGGERQVINRVKDAINAGYRHIDTAWLYGNEKAIGKAVKQLIANGMIKREDLFIATKVWNTYHSRPKVIESIKQSLKSLDMDYVDLALIHYPMAWLEGSDTHPQYRNRTYIDSNVDLIDTWRGMEDAVAMGLTKSIGVSNFNHFQVDRIASEAKIKPAVNQVESNAYLTQKELLEYCKNNSIVFVAYSPLGHGNRQLLRDRVIREIGNKYNKTVAQVLIRYQLERGAVTIPKSSRRQRIYENFNVFDFELTGDDMSKIDKLNKNYRNFDFDPHHRDYPFNAKY